MIELKEKEFNKYFGFLKIDFQRSGISLVEAEDIASDVIIKAVQTHDPERGAFSTHLYSVKSSMLIDFYRSKRQKMDKKTQPLYFENKNDEDNENNTTNVLDTLNIYEYDDKKLEREIDKKEIFKIIMKSFNRLKPMEKNLINDYYFNELRYSELVEKYNIPLGTVKGMLYRCKEKLHELLKDNSEVKEFLNM